MAKKVVYAPEMRFAIRKSHRTAQRTSSAKPRFIQKLTKRRFLLRADGYFLLYGFPMNVHPAFIRAHGIKALRTGIPVIKLRSVF